MSRSCHLLQSHQSVAEHTRADPRARSQALLHFQQASPTWQRQKRTRCGVSGPEGSEGLRLRCRVRGSSATVRKRRRLPGPPQSALLISSWVTDLNVSFKFNVTKHIWSNTDIHGGKKASRKLAKAQGRELSLLPTESPWR